MGLRPAQDAQCRSRANGEHSKREWSRMPTKHRLPLSNGGTTSCGEAEAFQYNELRGLNGLARGPALCSFETWVNTNGPLSDIAADRGPFVHTLTSCGGCLAFLDRGCV